MSAISPRAIKHGAHDLLFRTVHGHALIYNMCWEDPRIDRQLLMLDSRSRVVMLTSAGCNALDYLLDQPAEIHAVDVNPRQNALLQLKLALIEHADFEQLFALFGQGSDGDFRSIYRGVRDRLPDYARSFWDERIRFFANTSRRGSFYYYGTSGAVAWVVTRYLLRNPRLAETLFALLDATSLAEQQRLHQQLEPLTWNRFVNWLISQPLLLTLLGVPRPQIRLLERQYPDGLAGYVRTQLRHVLTEVAIHDNYFWRAYITGRYRADCCPNYLKAVNFPRLKEHCQRIHTHDCTVSQFLLRHPGQYSHFILLDHQDWLAWHRPEALAQEWRLILANATAGTRVLMRSAGLVLDFLPAWVQQRLRFFPDLTRLLHGQDRVGTYGSVHLAELL